MDELHGDQAMWQLDTEAVHIRYHQGRWQDAMLKRLGQCTVPLAAISSVDFTARERGRRWSLRLCLRERTDPYAAVGAMLTRRSTPFRLTGPARTQLVAEFWADQIAFAASQETEAATAGLPLAQRVAATMVPALPIHIQTREGTASFDGETVRLVWSGSVATSRKRNEQRREFALRDITGVEWVPSDGWQWGHLRVLTAEPDGRPPGKPKHDTSCLLCNEGSEGTLTMLLAATVTAHLWASGADQAPQLPAGADAQEIYERIRELGRLRDEGILSDAEFTTKKAELLDRL